MNRLKRIKMLNEALSVEEIPMMGNLQELRDLIQNSDLDTSTKTQMMKGIHKLMEDTAGHAQAFNNMLREVAK